MVRREEGRSVGGGLVPLLSTLSLSGALVHLTGSYSSGGPWPNGHSSSPKQK